MYTTIFSLLLATTGPACGAPDGGYGGYGSYGTYGRYGCGIGAPYYYYPYGLYTPGHGLYAPGQHADARTEDSGRKELEKRVGDLTSVMAGLVQKLRDMEVKVEQQSELANIQKQIAESNKELQARLTETINSKLADLHKNVPPMTASAPSHPTSPIAPAVLDSVNSGFAQLEARLRAIEDRDRINQHASAAHSTNEALNKMISLMEGMVKTNPDLVVALKDIKEEFTKVRLSHQEAPVSSRPITNGTALTRALIIVSLPADAKLFLDGQPSTVGCNLRTFITPDLETGKSYFYTLRVEVERNNKIYSDIQKINFQPGREVHVSFDHLDAAIANTLRKE